MSDPTENKVMKFMNDLIKKHNNIELEIKKQEEKHRKATYSYGVAVLNDGSVLKISKNFTILENLWIQINAAKTFGIDEELFKLYELSSGGLFVSDDIVIKIEDIKYLMRPQAYYDYSKDEKERHNLISDLIDGYIGNSLYIKEDIDDIDEEYDDD